MNYKLLGKSGLRVSELALGTMGFGQDWGWGQSLDESRQIFDAYAQAGGNFIDTAVNYTNGTSESFVGEFIHDDRGHFVVATKYSLGRRPQDPNAAGNSRKNMVESVNTSLKRLKTDYIDLYWLHAWDYTTPVEEVMRGLDDLVRQGKILYVGVSDTPAWVVSMASTLAELRGWSRFVALQIRYSLADRAAERDLLPMARALDLAVLPWSVLGAGVLTGKYNRDDNAQGRAKNWNVPERSYRIAQELIEVAEANGCTPSQAAIAWMLAQRSPHHAPVIPIVAARNLEQLADNLGALDVSLSAEQLARLDAASSIEYGFPHDFLSGEEIRKYLSAGTFDRLHNHRRVV
jgi:aryl-alcohol dehydrogenase-like predicted oxidoreductase